METVRTGVGGRWRVLALSCPERDAPHTAPLESSLLDIVYVIGILAVFALVGLVAGGVEKL